VKLLHGKVVVSEIVAWQTRWQLWEKANFTIQNGRRSSIFQNNPTKNNRLPKLPNRYIVTKFDWNRSKNVTCRAVTVLKRLILQFKMAADRPFFKIIQPKAIGFLSSPIGIL